MYKAVVFDLDKTLVDINPECWRIAFGKTLGDLGVRPTEELIAGLCGHDADRIVTEVLGLDCKEFWSRHDLNDTPELRVSYTIPYPDSDIIPELAGLGYRLGIVTGAPPGNAEGELAFVGRHHFRSVISAIEQLGIRYKPHPQGLELCLEELGVEKHEALYVGNGIEDIQLGRNAGVYTVFVDRNEHKALPFSPDCMVKDLRELRGILGLSESPRRAYSPPASTYENRPA